MHEKRGEYASSRGAKESLYHIGDEKSITVQWKAKAGYSEEAHKSVSAESLEGRRIRRQDSEIVVPGAIHVRDFWKRVRYVSASYVQSLFWAQ